MHNNIWRSLTVPLGKDILTRLSLSIKLSAGGLGCSMSPSVLFARSTTIWSPYCDVLYASFLKRNDHH